MSNLGGEKYEVGGEKLAGQIGIFLAERGIDYNLQTVALWGSIGELYMSVCLFGTGLEKIRLLQQEYQECSGVFPIGCNDYDKFILSVKSHGEPDYNFYSLLLPDGNFNKTEIPESLLKETLDFLRDGQ